MSAVYPKQNFRLTPQRKVILEELRKLASHPTADELYEIVRRRLPKISLGTVYRNLDMLSSQGIIQKLYVAESQMRFDGNTQPHSHVHCIECGRVADVSADLDTAALMHNVNTDFELMGYSLTFYGLCPECSRTSERVQ
jgi:Fur family ferric uptake transcriptional regulator